jgi:hypothetical protein
MSDIVNKCDNCGTKSLPGGQTACSFGIECIACEDCVCSDCHCCKHKHCNHSYETDDDSQNE